MDTTCDVVIIGAGPAGCVAAAHLVREGLDVRIVEREQFPRFVIGESLLPRCMDLLADAGLLQVVELQDFQVKDGAVFLRGEDKVSFQFEQQFTRGWSYTYQVQRARFDAVLAKTVEARGAKIDFRTSVVRADCSMGVPKLTVRGPNGVMRTISSRFVIDASGYGRVLPRLLDLDTPSTFPKRKALFTHLRGDQRPEYPEDGRIWVVSHAQHKGVWFWIIPFSDGTTSVGVVAEPEFFDLFHGGDENRLSEIIRSEPNVSRRIPEPEFLFAPRSIEGYAASVEKLYGEGFALVGNATEFLDPIFSSGVTLALESATRAARLVIEELRGAGIDWEQDFERYVRSGIDVFRSYVTAWYDGTLPEIIYRRDQRPDVMTKICSVLAGYVWDESNPFVRDHRRKIRQLAQLCSSSDPFVGACA